MDNNPTNLPAVAGETIDLEYKMQLAVVCALLTTKGIIDKVGLILMPEMFPHPTLRLIYTAAMQLYEKGMEIDVFTVERQMAVIDQKQYEEMQGIAFVRDGLLTVRDGSNVMYYAEEVKRLYLLKRIAAFCQDTLMKANSYQSDVQELLMECDINLRKILEEATSGRPTKSVAELADESLAEIRRRMSPNYVSSRILTGFNEYDYITGGLFPGELTVLGGRPSSGKTAVALTICLNAARAGDDVQLFSLEMNEQQLINRIWASISSVHPERLRMDSLTDADLFNLEQTRKQLATLPLHIEYTASMNLSTIRSKILAACKRGECKLAAIDYLNLVQSVSKGNYETQANIIGTIVNEIKNIAIVANIPILLLAQLNRNVEHRLDKLHLLEMSDLRDSGVIEQTADTVVFVYRSDRITSPEKGIDDGIPGVAKLDIKKNRNGGIGMARFRFNETCTKLWNYGQALPL